MGGGLGAGGEPRKQRVGKKGEGLQVLRFSVVAEAGDPRKRGGGNEGTRRRPEALRLPIFVARWLSSTTVAGVRVQNSFVDRKIPSSRWRPSPCKQPGYVRLCASPGSWPAPMLPSSPGTLESEPLVLLLLPSAV